MKLKPADISFSQCVRAAYDYVCQRCQVQKPPQSRRGGSGMELSHRYGRRHRTIRWAKDNGDCLCTGCHRYFTENPLDYAAWILERDGQGAIDLLREKRDSMVKVSKIEEKAIARHYRLQLKNIEEKRLNGETGVIPFESYQ